MFNRLSLKVALPLALAVTLVTLAITVAGTRYRHDRGVALARERGRNLAAITLDTIRAVTPDGHRPNLQPFLDELAKSPDVAAVRVLSPRWQVIRAARNHEIGRDMSREIMNAPSADPDGSRDLLVDRELMMHVVEPVVNAQQCHACHGTAPLLGYLDLELGVAHQDEVSIWRVLGTVTGTVQMLALLVLTGVVTTVLVSRPVRRLAQAMERVTAGDLDVKVAPTGTQEIDLVIAGFNTLTERLRDAAKREEEARRVQMARAEQLATVGEMAAGLAHEIRNPVAGVKAAVEVLASQMPPEDPKREILRESAGELDRLDEVIKSLLNFARPRPPERKVADLNQLVREAAMLTAGQAAVERAVILFELREPLPPVWVDTAMVRQVLVNLILNSVQALTGQLGTIVLSTDVRAGEVLARVADDGPGVSEAEAQNIFKPFVTFKPRGTGLGLSISRRLIELHGGRLWLDNPGRPGASFVFSVPIAGAVAPGPDEGPRHRAEPT